MRYGTTVLDPIFRGDTFVFSMTLSTDWVFSTFTGGVKMTFRRSASETTADGEALYQASISGGHIVASGANATVTIPASVTAQWPVGRLFWDLQGTIDAAEDIVYTIDAGTISVLADMTRSA